MRVREDTGKIADSRQLAVPASGQPKNPSSVTGPPAERGQLWMSPKTVETHVGSIFTKLGLAPAAEDHRRVLAVLAFLRQ